MSIEALQPNVTDIIGNSAADIIPLTGAPVAIIPIERLRFSSFTQSIMALAPAGADIELAVPIIIATSIAWYKDWIMEKDQTYILGISVYYYDSTAYLSEFLKNILK